MLIYASKSWYNSNTFVHPSISWFFMNPMALAYRLSVIGGHAIVTGEDDAGAVTSNGMGVAVADWAAHEQGIAYLILVIVR